MASNQSIFIKLGSFDHRELDKAVVQIMSIVKADGGKCRGPIPLPKRRKRFVLNVSPNGDKEAREVFEIGSSFRYLVIDFPTVRMMNAFNDFKLSAGIDVRIGFVQE